MHTRFVVLSIVVLLWSNPARGIQQQQSAMPVQVLQLYAGTYQIAPSMKLKVVLDGDHLVGRVGAQAFPLTRRSLEKGW
jgi:hypothetical protein